MQELTDRIERRTARCGVVGLGYVGLPLALEFAKAGFRVTGIDLDKRKVQAIEQWTRAMPCVDATRPT